MLRRCRRQPTTKRSERRWGTATVELAVTVPIFVTIVMGIAEMSRGLDVSERLSSAVRQGGREAAADMSGELPSGWTANQKVIKDIQNMLTAGGLDGSKVTVTITAADGSKAGSPFDLQDQSNYLKYFRITATLNYDQVAMFPGKLMKNQKLTSSVVFRLGRSSLSS